MNALAKKLQDIKEINSTIVSQIKAYEAGIITTSQMHITLTKLFVDVERIKCEICTQYIINRNGVNLMIDLP